MLLYRFKFYAPTFLGDSFDPVTQWRPSFIIMSTEPLYYNFTNGPFTDWKRTQGENKRYIYYDLPASHFLRWLNIGQMAVPQANSCRPFQHDFLKAHWHFKLAYPLSNILSDKSEFWDAVLYQSNQVYHAYSKRNGWEMLNNTLKPLNHKHVNTITCRGRTFADCSNIILLTCP